MDRQLLQTATVLKSALHLPASSQRCTVTKNFEVSNPFTDFEQYTKVGKWFTDFHQPLSWMPISGRSRQWHWSRQTICRLPDTFCTVTLNSIRKILKQKFQLQTSIRPPKLRNLNLSWIEKLYIFERTFQWTSNHLEQRSYEKDINFLINPYQNLLFTQSWNSNLHTSKLFPLIHNCSKLIEHPSNPHTNINPLAIPLFKTLFKNRLSIIKSILQPFKILSKTLKSLSSFISTNSQICYNIGANNYNTNSTGNNNLSL